MIWPGLPESMIHGAAKAVPMPAFEDRLLNLPPSQRVAAGVVGVCGCPALSMWLWDQDWIWFGAVFFAVFGLALLGSGLVGLRHQGRLDREARRALDQWTDVMQELELARRTRSGIERTLTRLGFREPEVRAWLREQSGIDRSAPSDPR